MFKNLFNMSVRHTGKEAFVFYIFYLILGLIFAGLISGSAGATYCVLNPDLCQTYDESFKVGQKIGSVVGLVSVFFYIFGLGTWILIARKLYKNVAGIILFLLSVVLAIPFGAIFALIPLACLTTLNPNKAKAEAPVEQDAQEAQDNSDV